MALPLFAKDSFVPTKALVALLLFAGLALFMISFSQRSAFVSSEYKFTDASARGLAIVPASCPSSPHYAGECDTTNPVPLACSISSSSWVITRGQSAVLSWRGPQGTNSFGFPVTYVSGNITSIGVVPQSGSQSVSPLVTTTYSYTGTERIAGIFNSQFACDATVTVLPSCPDGQTLGTDGICRAPSCPTGQVIGTDGFCHVSACPSGQTLGTDGACHVTTCPTGQALGTDGLCHVSGCPGTYAYCGTGAAANNLYQRTYSAAPACSPLNSLIATCRYGCASGNCVAPPSVPTISLHVTPVLVQQGTVVQVSWYSTGITTATNASGVCTVTGTNGDSWAGLSGTQTSSAIQQQTRYTLTCTPGGGTAVSQTATVNVVPVFQEQ